MNFPFRSLYCRVSTITLILMSSKSIKFSSIFAILSPKNSGTVVLSTQKLIGLFNSWRLVCVVFLPTKIRV